MELSKLREKLLLLLKGRKLIVISSGLVVCGSLMFGVYAYYKSAAEQKAYYEDIDEAVLQEDYKRLYDDSVFMNANNIMNEEERESNNEKLVLINEHLSDLSDEEVNMLKTLNDLLTLQAESNKKSMTDALDLLESQYNITLEGEEAAQFDNCINISVSQSDMDNINSQFDLISEDIREGYYKNANEKLIELGKLLSGFDKGSNGSVFVTKVDSEGNVTLEKTDNNSSDEESVQSSASQDTNTSNNISEFVANNNISSSENQGNGNSGNSTVSNPIINNTNEAPVTEPVPTPAPEPVPQPEPQKPKYTAEDNNKINSILNNWFDMLISEQEANQQLKVAFPNMDVKVCHMQDAGQAKEFWNGLSDEYLKSNILISDKHGAFFAYGK